MNMVKVFLTLALIVAMPVIVLAESKYSFKEVTPEAQAALDGRRSRFDELTDLKAKGIVGENNRGYVELLVSDDSARKIVEAENRDRKIIYKTIAEQNGLTGQLETIEKVFAQVQYEKAPSGSKVQDESGRWVTKP